MFTPDLPGGKISKVEIYIYGQSFLSVYFMLIIYMIIHSINTV